MNVWRVLRQSAQLHNPFAHVAVDATHYERSPASKHYCDRTNYRVQTIKAKKFVDTGIWEILDVHCTTTREGSDAEVYAQLARTEGNGGERVLSGAIELRKDGSVADC